jgi:hypothetical protein
MPVTKPLLYLYFTAWVDKPLVDTDLGFAVFMPLLPVDAQVVNPTPPDTVLRFCKRSTEHDWMQSSQH